MTAAQQQRVPLKDQLFTRAKVELIAGEIEREHPAVPAAEFVSSVVPRFPELELKARISWITTCLEELLPRDFRPAVDVLLRSLPRPVDPTRSLGDFRRLHLRRLRRLRRIRRLPWLHCREPRILAGHASPNHHAALGRVRDPATARRRPRSGAGTLLVWTDDEHYHVRRLCSEGTGPGPALC